jgi:alpha-galactosidase
LEQLEHDLQAWADGDLLVDTGVAQGKAPAKSIAVDVTGKNELRLYVGNGNDGNDFDHADWGNAQLNCAP